MADENGRWKGSVEESIQNIEEDIKEIKSKIDCIFDKIMTMEKEIELLKYKISVSGSIAGFLGGLIPALVYFIYWISRR